MAVTITEIAERQRSLYEREPRELISHYNREISALDGYRGRQILELLQNADDAGADRPDGCRVVFALERSRLVVANTGTPFTHDGLMSLVISDCSPKQLERNRFIGCKGLGFRAVLTWTDRPLIISGPLQVCFDRQAASSYIQKLAQSGSAFDRVATFHNAEGRWPVPVMRFPSVPAQDDLDLQVATSFQRKGFTTVIVLPLPTGGRGDELHGEIAKQLKELPTSATLFCRHLTDVEIEGDVTRRWKLLRESTDDERSSVIVSDGEQDRYWDIYLRSGQIPAEVASESGGARREYEIGIAVPESPDMACDGNTLCVFFPTSEILPCPLILHATVETTDDRNGIIDHASNRSVLCALADYVAGVIEQKSHNAGVDIPLRLLCGIEKANHKLIKLGFIDRLKQSVRGRGVFPRLDGHMGTADSTFLPTHKVWAAVVNARWFPEMLLTLPSDQQLLRLVRWLGLEWFDDTTLKQRLTGMVAGLMPADAGKALGLLTAAKEMESIGVNGLLLEQQGAVIPDGELCFFKPSEKLPDPPAWAREVRFLDADFQKGLLEASGHSSLRGLADELKRNGASVSEYRFDTVARAVISHSDSQNDLPKDHQLQRCRDLLAWLFRASEGARQDLSTLPVKIVTSRAMLKRTTAVYLSREYPEGQLLSRLYGPLDEDDFVASPDGLGLSDYSEAQVQEFLLALGVHATPRIVKMTFSHDSPKPNKAFLEHVIETLPFPISLRSKRFESPSDLRKHVIYGIEGLSVPDRFLRLLTQGDPVAVMAYLLSKQQADILAKHIEEACFTAALPGERYQRHDKGIPIPNPVLHWLSETRWIPCQDGGRHRPAEIMLSATGQRVLPSVYHRHVLEHRDGLLSSQGGRQAVEAMLWRLGAVASLEQMESEQVYDLLLSLPERDSEGKSASAIYRTLLEANIVVEDGPNRLKFLQSGKVWAKRHGRGQYLPVSQVRYNANVTLPDAVVCRMALLDLPRRRNTTAVRNLLGVNLLSSGEYTLEVLPEKTEYDVHSEYANIFLRQCIPYIYALRLGKKIDDDFRERNLLKSTSLYVCKHVWVRVSIEGEDPDILALDRSKDRICIGPKLYVVGEYDMSGAGATRFWLSVASLIAEALGTDVSAEVGAILRCRSEAEMEEVVEEFLGAEAGAKLEEARGRFQDWTPPEEDRGVFIVPSDSPSGPRDNEAEEHSDKPTQSTERDEKTHADFIDDIRHEHRFTETIPPDRKPINKRRLVIKRHGGGVGGGGHGPIATEELTFRIVEAFERQSGEDRIVIDVSHIRGTEGLGCDLISVLSEEIKRNTLATGKIAEADVARFIEVKGRSSRSGEVELTENEYRAAERFKERYFLYRVFVDPNDPSVYEVAILQDPVHSSATRTVTRFELSKGSGAKWYALEEVSDG
jgi:hypothetical protein